MTDPESLLAEEILIVRHSGEIPEIAFHGSLYYLCEDPTGPQLTLTEKERDVLRQQVVARYREILLRDLNPDNRDATIYRGLKRCIFNWERLGKFCKRQGLAVEDVRQEIARALRSFLHQEANEVRAGLRHSCLNCTKEELGIFAGAIGVRPEELPEGLEMLFCTPA
ncbi:MAG: hypothetical protein FP813_06800 [Desulfurivibrio sp.]|nr:hypothetical protein [Desulfurivibrio sp.]MBU3937723.1 hypothetical protein [Pseudomonadota bacterium]MBU4034161.1 hypothetical protein [Pseudomonadota bacterium]MBU4118170.1 hypothetical protein [Pseudomonadota bacterium]